MFIALDDGFVARRTTLTALVHGNNPQMVRGWMIKTLPLNNMLPVALTSTIGLRSTLMALNGVQHGIPQDGVDARLIPLATAFEP